MANRDFYEILSVGRTATNDEIKKAYRQMAMKYHPDRNPGDTEAEDKFKEASEAYSILADPEKRKIYDQYGHDGLRMGGRSSGDFFSESVFSDFEDILGGFFGFGSSRSRGGGRRPRRGRDVGMEISLTMEEAYHGVEKEIEVQKEINCDTCDGSGSEPGKPPEACRQCGGTGSVRRNQGFFSIATSCPVCNGAGKVVKHPCVKCNGRGRVHENRKIKVSFPAGINTGNKMRVAHEGEGGLNGGPSGDLYLIIQLEEDDRFEREENNLIYHLDITFAQAALGDEIKIQTFYGTEKIKIHPETQSGKIIRIKGKGFKNVNGWGKGDLMVILGVVTPVKLSKQEKALFKELRQIEMSKVRDSSGAREKIYN